MLSKGAKGVHCGSSAIRRAAAGGSDVAHLGFLGIGDHNVSIASGEVFGATFRFGDAVDGDAKACARMLADSVGECFGAFLASQFFGTAVADETVARDIGVSDDRFEESIAGGGSH